ncbi:hypothetical protein Forpi1262_v015340 [Fusarium oxysporum f. sp. raphani]|uniref:Uncharacterized protein n=1 Tax=Fusarium oxysporum f. sp. raphani TaxID=96318 RepID=A0A8J5PCK6_FUSOX|nr:hypothetical protein Forpi1262_v015340 [Fusarium oxysporum f. sp. raphani]
MSLFALSRDVYRAIGVANGGRKDGLNCQKKTQKRGLNTICFSDEVTVQNALNNPDGWVFRRPDEKYCKDLVNI